MNYWSIWNTAYYRAIDALASRHYQKELKQFQNKWNLMITKRTGGE